MSGGVLEKGTTGRVTVTYADSLCCCVVIGANICGASLVWLFRKSARC